MSPGDIVWEDRPNKNWSWRSQELRHVRFGTNCYAYLRNDRQRYALSISVQTYEPIEFLHALLQFEPVTRRGKP